MFSPRENTGVWHLHCSDLTVPEREREEESHSQHYFIQHIKEAHNNVTYLIVFQTSTTTLFPCLRHCDARFSFEAVVFNFINTTHTSVHSTVSAWYSPDSTAANICTFPFSNTFLVDGFFHSLFKRTKNCQSDKERLPLLYSVILFFSLVSSYSFNLFTVEHFLQFKVNTLTHANN